MADFKEVLGGLIMEHPQARMSASHYLKNLGEDSNGYLKESDNRYIPVGFGKEIQRGRIRESLMHLVNLQRSICNGECPSEEEMLELQNVIDERVDRIEHDNELIELEKWNGDMWE